MFNLLHCLYFISIMMPVYDFDKRCVYISVQRTIKERSLVSFVPGDVTAFGY